MSLFEEAGKRFEETKRAFLDGAETGYVCRTCETAVEEDYDFCPHCGNETVEPVE